MKTSRLIGFILLLLPGFAWAQQDSSLSNWQSRKLAFAQPVQVDSLAFFPFSLQVWLDGKALSDSSWRLQGDSLWVQPQGDSLFLRYRRLPQNLIGIRRHKQLQIIGQTEQAERVLGSDYVYTPEEKAGFGPLEDVGGLNYSGNIARGLSVGNRQDLVLNSSFNMQLAGKLGDVEISGAITDNNIPLQPEGNTQQLQDFDRIFIQFKLDKTRLIAGDYDLKRPEGSYFMNYFKRLQGLQVQTAWGNSRNGEVTADGSFAISRGKFGRNSFLGEEGNQGPYRLQGNDGEGFIIILAGTERVFIDGMLMKRGANNDYTIDYNTGELTFTNRRLITKDIRIQVEFEYSDLNYLRTLYAANTTWKKDRFQARFNIYSEQDNRNQPAQAELSDLDRRALRNAGDASEGALTPSLDVPEEGFSPNLILYKLIDSTVVGQRYDSVLVYSTNPDSAFYHVRFSEVGLGQGNYLPLSTQANGQVFTWVAPDPNTGQPRGSHAPLIRLIPPQKRQLINVGGDYQIGKKGKLSADAAFSLEDLNTFSERDAEDDQGRALRLSYEDQWQLRKDSVARSQVEVRFHYEQLNANFEDVEPFRPREFERDWNVDDLEQRQQQLGSAAINWQDSRWGRLQYELSTLLVDSSYQGLQNNLQANIERGGFRLKGTASLVNGRSAAERNQFFRPRVELSQKVGEHWRIGFYNEQEHNQRWDQAADTLYANSFYYNVLRAFAELPRGEKKFWWRVSAQRRFDYAPVERAFETSTVADEINLRGNWQAGNSQLDWNINYRNLQIQDSLLTEEQPRETYLGRIEYNFRAKKGWLRLSTGYELGAGQQQRVDYNYVEVDEGQGTYQWIDRNEDGAQQQDEFEQANFQDQANYVRVSILTGDFIRSNNLRFNQSLSFQPRTLLRKTEHWAGKIIKRFSSQSVWNLERKTLANAAVLPYNPFEWDVVDSSLVDISNSLRNSLYFNRSGQKISLELGQLEARSKNLLSNGFQAQRRSEWRLRLRWNLSKQLTLEWPVAQGRNDNRSDFFQNRNYALNYQETEPELSWMYERSIRLAFSYRYKNSDNLLGVERASSHKGSLELTYTQLSKTNIRSSFSFVQMDYSGDNNSPVAFALLEGLQPGRNLLWTLNFSRNLSRNIQLSLSYEGRKTGEARMVHVGRAQVRANF